MIVEIKLVDDGLDAAENRMPESLKRQISEGMQIFAGAQLSYFVEGRVPDKIMDRTRYYRLHDFQERPACWIAELDISVVPDIVVYGYFFKEVAKGIVGDVAKDMAKKAMRDFLQDRWKPGRLAA